MTYYFDMRRVILSLDLEQTSHKGSSNTKQWVLSPMLLTYEKKTGKRRRICKDVYFYLLTCCGTRYDEGAYSILIYYFNERNKRWTEKSWQKSIVPHWMVPARDVRENICQWWWTMSYTCWLLCDMTQRLSIYMWNSSQKPVEVSHQQEK